MTTSLIVVMADNKRDRLQRNAPMEPAQVAAVLKRLG